jgi:hypothetical protein
VSDHIPDATKMISDTPRTDAELEFDPTSVDEVLDWSRQLERELNASNERIKRLEDIISRASSRFFRDGSNGMVAIGMLNILEEVRLK